MNITESFFIRHEGKYARIRLKEICYISAFKNYVRIHTLQKEFKTQFSLNNLEEILPANYFCRIHRSYIVAIDAVRGFEYEKIDLGQVTLPLKDKYRKHFFQKVNLINPVYKKQSISLFS